MHRRELLKNTAVAAALGSLAGMHDSAIASGLNTDLNVSNAKLVRSMKKIDMYSHFSFVKLLDYLEEHNQHRPHVFRRLFANTPALTDVRARLKLMDQFGFQRHVLVPLPWLETVPAVHANPETAREASVLCNDMMAHVCEQYPERFSGVSLVPNTTTSIMIEEFTRSVKQLKLAGGMIAVGPTAKRPDHPDYDKLYKAAEQMDVPIWLHPSRPKNYPDYSDEPISKYQIWQAFSWLLDSTAAMVRIVFDGTFERYPNLKLVIHHHGALIPLFANRLTYGLDYFESASGAHVDTEISKPYIEHFKKFYCDTATQGFDPLVLQGAFNFFGAEHMLFGSDAPMDATAGEIFISGAVESLSGLNMSASDYRMVLFQNAERLLKL